ncbi:MAG TPA: hypothetical protein PKM82_01445 [Acidovorax sp.]|nr:hypothetical protein [Acidovorax sp.]
MRKLFRILTLSLITLLVACGGGGGSSGTSSNGAPVTVSVASIIYQLDKNALTNSGVDEATLTVTALDAGNNPVANVALAVSVNSGVYTPVVTVSDATGKASGKISIGGNKANRDIAAAIKMGDKTATAVIPVTGSKVALSLVPAAPVPGGPATLSIKVTDVNGSGIAQAPVKLGGTLGFTQSVTTDSGGNATVQLQAAPVSAGTYTILATASGVTAQTPDVQVLLPGGTGIPNATGVISAASLAITPNTIAPNAAASSTNRAGLRAVFQNGANQAIANVRARFEIVPPGLGSGEVISTGVATVYSDASGQVLSEYIAGTRSSPTDGVRIRVCYGLTDAEIANGACPNSRTATMTVASQPLSITLGDNNELAKGANNLTYIKKFDIAVADAAGNAVSNAQISASVDLRFYGKGPYASPRTWCPNEDLNRNGFLDADEIIAGDGDNEISPRKADVVLSFIGDKTTGTNGRSTVQVEYPMNVATWLVYAVKVTTSVAGSEGVVEKTYTTGFIEGDDKNGSFLTPAYGVNNCRTPR